jgi:hypothetical protein
MLNLGGQAINKMKVAMTEAFAEKADEYGDKMVILGGKVGGLARGLTVALLPALTSITDAITKGVEVFSKLPEPIQKTMGGIVLLSMAMGALKFTGILSGLGLLMGAFKALAGLQLAATFAGWAGAIGPAVAAITTALTGLIAWIGATLVPAMLAFFSGPVGWITLAVAAVIAGVILFREPIMKFIGWLWQQTESIRSIFVNIGTLIEEAAKLWFQALYTVFFKPFVDSWLKPLREPISKFLAFAGEILATVWDSIKKRFEDKYIKPVVELWNELSKSPEQFAKDAEKAFTDLRNNTVNLFLGIASAIKKPFVDMLDELFSRIQSFIQGNKNAINGAIASYNKVAESINQIPAPLKFFTPNLPILEPFGATEQSLPPRPAAFPGLARGGWVSKDTIVRIGEGGDPGGEYAIPAQMMPAAMAAWSQGARGDALVSAMRSPGLAPGRSTTSPQSSGGGPRNLTINLQSGPVMQMADGSQWVQREELVALAEALLDATGDLNGSSAMRSVNGWS